MLSFSCKDKSKRRALTITPAVSNGNEQQNKETFKVTPIQHASMILSFGGQTIYVDPVGNNYSYAEKPKATIILITDIHPDHLDTHLLPDLMQEKTMLIVPEAVQEKLPVTLQKRATVLHNGEVKNILGISIKAIPMYNLREKAKKFHPKGRGNGYVLTKKEFDIYIAGDTEDIPEMRQLKGIDVAFIPMNLPYTMPVSKAADAVLDFSPKTVYPYHYKGKNGLSNVALFKNIIETNNAQIKVVQLNWYPEE